MHEKKFSEYIQKFFKALMILMLVSMVAMVFLNAVLRYVLNKGIPEVEEYSRFCFIWTTFLGIIYAYRGGEHVAVTLLVDALKGVPKIIFKVIERLLTLFTLGFILVGGILYTKYTSTYLTAATNTNFALISVSIVVMAAGMLAIDIRNIISELRGKSQGSEEGGLKQCN
jgi:TRAP-type C4-dicarboxylate transport system permease small subunit